MESAFFAPFKKLVRQIFFAYFLPNLPNKKFSGIFFGDFLFFLLSLQEGGLNAKFLLFHARGW